MSAAAAKYGRQTQTLLFSASAAAGEGAEKEV